MAAHPTQSFESHGLAGESPLHFHPNMFHGEEKQNEEVKVDDGSKVPPMDRRIDGSNTNPDGIRCWLRFSGVNVARTPKATGFMLKMFRFASPNLAKTLIELSTRESALIE